MALFTPSHISDTQKAFYHSYRRLPGNYRYVKKSVVFPELLVTICWSSAWFAIPLD